MQSFIAGATNYGEQTDKDICADIKYWIEYSKQIADYFNETISDLKADGYWNTTVPFDFRMFAEDVPRVLTTFINDFQIIQSEIENGEISTKSVKLLRTISETTRSNEELSWKTYKNPEDKYWKDYDSIQFRKAETLYSEGRDYFVTLKDTGNAASRIEDYINEGRKVSLNIHNDNSISIGDKNKISKSKIGNNKTIKEVESTKIREKVMWKIVAPIIVGVLVALITLWLNIK